MKSQLIIAIDYDPSTLRAVELELSEQGFSVITATHPDEGLMLFEKQRPDLVLLDTIFPDVDGAEVLRRIRTWNSETPIIFLTAKSAEADQITYLELGADDYIIKPFSLEVMSTRVRTILRRTTRRQESHKLRAGNIQIDLQARLVMESGKVLKLTRQEWALLECLARNFGRVMRTSELLTKVWGPEYASDIQYLGTWVSKLRAKLGDDTKSQRVIKTFVGIGYMLDAHMEEESE